jgi:hypothetical protein
MPVKGFSKSLTSFQRPLLRLATADIVGLEASGFVPASDLNGGSSRGGQVCFSVSFREVLSTLTRDLCVFLVFYRVSCNNLYLHSMILI